MEKLPQIDEKIINEIFVCIEQISYEMSISSRINLIFTIIFLKIISNIFQQKYNELLEEGAGFEEDKDEYEIENIPYLPKDARWNEISKYYHEMTINIIFNQAIREIEKENPFLKGLLQNINLPTVNYRRLSEILIIVENFDSDYELIEIFDYLMEIFSKNKRNNNEIQLDNANDLRKILRIKKNNS